jgi:hypothetical protein
MTKLDFEQVDTKSISKILQTKYNIYRVLEKYTKFDDDIITNTVYVIYVNNIPTSYSTSIHNAKVISNITLDMFINNFILQNNEKCYRYYTANKIELYTFNKNYIYSYEKLIYSIEIKELYPYDLYR